MPAKGALVFCLHGRCTACVPGIPRGQKRVPHFMQPELEMIVSLRVSTRN